MYLFCVTTYPNLNQQENDYEAFESEQDWYYSALSKNGQILIKSCNSIFKEDRYITYFIAPDLDALEDKYANKYVRECYNSLLTVSLQPPNIELLGKSADYEPSCTCTTPSWYMLYTDWATNDSPVVCGDCGRSVPLYKLPKILGEEEYYSVLGWQKAYNAYDRLFLEGFGERYAYQKLSKITSDLSVTGREICREWENAIGKPFYYYMFRYYSSHKKTCPLCGEPWKLGDDNTLFVDYRCNKCRLVADKA